MAPAKKDPNSELINGVGKLLLKHPIGWVVMLLLASGNERLWTLIGVAAPGHEAVKEVRADVKEMKPRLETVEIKMNALLVEFERLRMEARRTAGQ